MLIREETAEHVGTIIITERLSARQPNSAT